MRDRRENEPPDSRDAMLTGIRRSYAEALLRGDEIRAELAIRDALDARLGAAEIDDEIIAPALWLVGELWERGEISVADEHIATEISLRVLALEHEAERLARDRRGRRVMLAAPQGERHVVALRMTGSLLRDAGYRVLMVGGDVPPEALAATAVRHKPDVVCLSATMPGEEDRAFVAMEEVQRQWPSAGFVLGGRGLTSRSRANPGVEVCRRVGEVVEAVDAVVQRAGFN
jgi:methanogenic corrinoid protein MtbC1